MHWELWDTQSANLVEDFATEDEALQAVREILAVNHPDYVHFLALGAMYDEGESRDEELPPVLSGAELQSRLAEIAQADVADATRSVHERIRKWLSEEGWRVDDLPVPPDSFNIVAVRHNGQAINIFQPKDVLDHVALSLRWSYDRVRQMIGELDDGKIDGLKWDIYRDSSLMGVDVYDANDSLEDLILRAYVYFDGLTKDTLMQRIQLVNRAYALAMRMSVRAQEAPDRPAGHALSPEDVRRIMRPIAEAAGPITVAS